MSRRHHENNLESRFVGPLALLRQHVGPFALQTCYKQMTESVYYRTEVVQRPEGLREWVRCLILAYS